MKVYTDYPLFGLANVTGYVRYMAIHAGILVIIGLFRTDIRLAPTYASVTSLLSFFVVPAPIMGFDWKFLYPATPVIFVIASLGLGNFIYRLSTKYNSSRLVLSSCCVVLALVCAGLLRDARAVISIRQDYAQSMARAHIPLGKFLSSLYENTDSPLLAIGDAGAVPYYSHWKTIDTYGLNDNEIARTGKHDPRYVLSMKPDLIVLISRKEDSFEPRLDWEEQLYEASLTDNYVRAKSLHFGHEYYLWLMVSSDSLVGERVKTWSYIPDKPLDPVEWLRSTLPLTHD